MNAHGTFDAPRLKDFIALGREHWREVRIALSALLARDNPTLRDDATLRQRTLVPQSDARMHLPVEIPGYTDFYSSKEHATNVGSMFAIRRTRCCRTGRRCRSATTDAHRR